MSVRVPGTLTFFTEDATDFAEDLNAEFSDRDTVDLGAVEDELEAMLNDPDISTDIIPSSSTAAPALNIAVPSYEHTPIPPPARSGNESERSQLLAHMAA